MITKIALIGALPSVICFSFKTQIISFHCLQLCTMYMDFKLSLQIHTCFTASSTSGSGGTINLGSLLSSSSGDCKDCIVDDQVGDIRKSYPCAKHGQKIPDRYVCSLCTKTFHSINFKLAKG